MGQNTLSVSCKHPHVHEREREGPKPDLALSVCVSWQEGQMTRRIYGEKTRKRSSAGSGERRGDTDENQNTPTQKWQEL